VVSNPFRPEKGAKLYYYKFWKYMRSVAMVTLKNGYIQKTGSLTDKLSNDFYGFLQKLYNELIMKLETRFLGILSI
jgi:hypothetical protein